MSKITVFSLIFLFIAGVAALYIIVNREPLAPRPSFSFGFQVAHESEIIELPDGIIQNNYKIIIPNETPNHQKYIVTLHNFPEAKIIMDGSWEEIDVKDLYVSRESVGRWDIFIRAPKQKEASRKISFRVLEVDTKKIGKYDTVFISEKVENDGLSNAKK